MSEADKPLEGTGLTREHILLAFRALTLQGTKNPAKLDEGDVEVKAANALLDAWINQEVARATSDEDLLNCDFSVATVLVDAGFTDSGYVRSVIKNQLHPTLRQAKDGKFGELAQKIEAKIKELENKNKFN